MPRQQPVAGKSCAVTCLALMLVTCLSLACLGCGGGQAAQPGTSPQSGQMSIQPASVNVSTAGTQQFTVSGAAAGAVISWAVNGAAGRNATVGTILSSGLYKAPATVPSGMITISATVAGSAATASTAPSVTLLPDGTVLVAGGGAGVSGIDQVSLNSAELYNPASGTFTMVNPMAVGRAYQTATLLNDGSVLIAGGEQRHGCCMPLPNAEVYSPGSKSFSTVGSMAFPRVFHTATLLPTGRVHVIGGGDAITEIYDPTQAAFLQSISLQLPRTNHTATLLPNNGGILVCGGILPSLGLGNVVTASCEIVP